MSALAISRRLLDRCLMPAWRGREFSSIRRADVAKMLDEVEDGSGGPTADHCLALMRNLANWYAARNEGYTSPIVKGMRRINPAERARSRILRDEELSQVWRAAEANGSFGAFLQLCLLTAQRREKVLTMKWDDVSVDGTWKVPSEEREKRTGGELPLLRLPSILSAPSPASLITLMCSPARAWAPFPVSASAKTNSMRR